MRLKGVLALAVAGVITVSAFSGCGEKKTDNTAANSTESKTDETVDIEVWYTNPGFQAIEKGSTLYNFYKEKIGVGIIHPYVEWNGGTAYQQQLNLKIAANEMPDMFIPYNGMEASLAQSGAIMDLTDLLPQKAPNLWKTIPVEAWNVMKSYDPNGKGRIYAVPSVLDYTLMGGMIRKDWLDKLGLSMPKTQDEFVKVLEAFRDRDPNGNSQKDELPTGGRQQAKWMDHLFAMYGLAMWEGDPQWDIYDGKLTYAAVTPNMKDALAFISKLYSQGLLDKETLLNDKSKWEGKIDSNRVGVFYHWAESVNERLENINKATGVKADYSILPAIDAPGYKSFYTTKKVKTPQWVIKNQKDQKKIEACFKLLNAYGDKNLWTDFYLGAKGMHSDVKDGKLVRLPDDKAKQQNIAIQPANDISTIDFKIKLINDIASAERKWALDQNIRNIQDNQKYGKQIAGDGIPSSIYANYPDIQNKTLYVEYASKIITGEYPISKFDEFVDKWNKSGGEAVTKAARDWYAKVQQK